jgi:hypothetical protein
MTIRQSPVLWLPVLENGRKVLLKGEVRSTGVYFTLTDDVEGAYVLNEFNTCSADYARNLTRRYERDNVRKLVDDALNATYVYEVGIDEPYEGLRQAKLFRDFDAAWKYARELDAEQDSYSFDSTVAVYPRVIE